MVFIWDVLPSNHWLEHPIAAWVKAYGISKMSCSIHLFMLTALCLDLFMADGRFKLTSSPSNDKPLPFISQYHYFHYYLYVFSSFVSLGFEAFVT